MKTFPKLAHTTMLTIALSAFALLGCAHHERQGDTAQDKAISKSINTALHHSRGYNYPDVTVSSHGGVVHLDGAVEYDEQKSRAAKVARSVDGVRQVVNNLAVRQYPTGRLPIITSDEP